MSPTKSTQKSAKSSAAAAKKGFSAEEKAAMKQRVKEMKAEAEQANGEKDALESIAKMDGPDRAMGERIHALVKASAPGLMAKTWYGMPSYALDGKVVCFFKPAQKFGTRYATFEFTDAAKLDEGRLWPVSFAVKELTAAEEAKIKAMVKMAVG
ncbi:MAG: hypothetical protein ABI847_04515 [Anaerolineales bacterium]